MAPTSRAPAAPAVALTLTVLLTLGAAGSALAAGPDTALAPPLPPAPATDPPPLPSDAPPSGPIVAEIAPSSPAPVETLPPLGSVRGPDDAASPPAHALPAGSPDAVTGPLALSGLTVLVIVAVASLAGATLAAIRRR